MKRIATVVEPFCRRRSPAHARHQVRTEYRVDGQEVLIVEVRVVWNDPSRWLEQEHILVVGERGFQRIVNADSGGT